MESGWQAGGETGGGPHGLRRFRTRFKPLSGGVWLFGPREGTGAGQPVERGRDAYAGRDIPCAPLSKGTLPHGLAALTVRQHALPGPAPAPSHPLGWRGGRQSQ